MISMILLTTDDKSGGYHDNAISVLFNTDHTISYLMHYLKSSGKVPSWVRGVHVFMNNAGSKNKNQYMMAAALEIVQQGTMDYFQISFMNRAHKVCPRPIVFHNCKRFLFF